MRLPSPSQKDLEALLPRGVAMILGLVVFFVPLAFYLLPGWDKLQDRPPALDVGVVTVAAALGGLVLNAGLNLEGRKRRETIRVAQKFIAVVILIILSLPTLHFVGLLDDIEPGSLEAWVRGFFFWIAAISFFGGTILFIVALIDLAFTMVGIGKKDCTCRGKQGTPAQDSPCGGGSNSDAS